MQESTIQSYGGPFLDQEPVNNPTTQQSADFGNRALEDTAQLTRTGIRAWVKFRPTAAAAPVLYAPNDVTAWSLWGDSDFVKPSVQKTADGRYTITYAATMQDGLSQDEAVSFAFAHAALIADADTVAAPAPQIESITGTVVKVAVLNNAFALTDHAALADVVLVIR